MDAPAPFNRLRVRAHRARASAAFEDVLVARVADDLAGRLAAVNRDFARTLVVGGARTFVPAAAAEQGLTARLGVLLSMDVTARLLPGTTLRVVGDEEALPFANGALGAVVSIFTLHWINDLPGALIQMRRALKPDGLLLAAMFGGRTLSELREALLIAESEVRGGAGARIAPFTDTFDAAGLLQRAGFALPVVDRERVVLRYRDPLLLLADLRAMGETSALLTRAPPLTRAILARMREVYRERFSDADGRVRATFEILTLTGWTPHESQQKPLKPGSAKARLADALNVKEQSAGEKAGKG